MPGQADQSNAPSNSLCRQQHVFPRVQLVGVGVLPVQVLAHGLGGELRLADVAKVPRQVDGFTWGREEEGGGCDCSVNNKVFPHWVYSHQTGRDEDMEYLFSFYPSLHLKCNYSSRFLQVERLKRSTAYSKELGLFFNSTFRLKIKVFIVYLRRVKCYIFLLNILII